MDKYELQAIENISVVILVLGIIVCSALFSWWLLFLLLACSPTKYVKQIKEKKQNENTN